MNLFLICSLILFHGITVFSQNENDLLFEDYWKKLKINFASLSETSNPEINEEDALRYSAFVVRCMRGHDDSIIIWNGRRKTVYLCSENKDKVDAYIKDEQEFYRQNLRGIAEVIKQGKVCFIQKLGETKDRCFIAARKSEKLQKIDELRLGNVAMNLAQNEEEGTFSIDGCDIKVTQIYHEGVVNLEDMYPSENDTSDNSK